MAAILDQRLQTVANMNKDRRACCVAAVLMLLLIMVSFNFDLTVDWQRMILRELNSESDPKTGHNSLKPPKVDELLHKLRETSRLAASGHDYVLTAAEREAWHEQYPCESRSELPAMYAARKHVRDVTSNPMWDEVFDEYSNLHRICMKRVGNVSEHFLSKYRHDSSTVDEVPGCKFLLTEGKYGLGNRLLVTVSAMLYAIVTQRVLLVPSWMTFKTIFCEPFVGSSWLVDAETFPMPQEGLEDNTWEEAGVFRENLDQRLKEVDQQGQTGKSGTSTSLPPLVNAVVVSATWAWEPWAPEKWFFCSTEQRFLSEVPWVYFSGCLYSIPELFGSAPFGPTLQALFPDRLVITQLMRSTLLPSDKVWSRFKHLNHVYFQNVERRVGIQLRFFDDRHATMSGVMNDRILDCALSNDVLPKLRNDTVLSRGHERQGNSRQSGLSAPITKIFIASLYSELHDHLSEFYLRSPTDTGEAVGVVQLTTRQEQSAGSEEDQEALVEMLLLSFSDDLLITPVSTFGGIGQAYGGLTPWFIRVNPEDGESCERGKTVDPCQQNAHLGYHCPNDHPSSAPAWEGVLGYCLKVDLGERIASGIQILDHRLSSS